MSKGSFLRFLDLVSKSDLKYSEILSEQNISKQNPEIQAQDWNDKLEITT